MSKQLVSLMISYHEFHIFDVTAQAKSVYLGSGGGKNANTIALR